MQILDSFVVIIKQIVAVGAIIAALIGGDTTAGTTATRLDNAVQVTDTLPPPPVPIPTGLNGLPFAPPELSGCDEMEWYSDQGGLPDDFHWIGYEESRCTNTASTWCCHGYWQIHTLHIGERSSAECGVTSKWDYDDTTAISKQKSACMAFIVLDRQGVCAWDVVRC